MNLQKITNTDSIAELAKFWDENDITDFEDQLEEVNEPVFERNMEVKITSKPTAVKEAASLTGIDSVDMMRECILSEGGAIGPDRLHQQPKIYFPIRSAGCRSAMEPSRPIPVL